ncbi:Gfo/Idh/MocA family protein [Actinomycetota bacterium Odt1-20B]
MSEAVGVAVLGAGHMGADHVRRIARSVGGARLVAVADPDVARAEAALDGLDVDSGVRLYGDPLDAIAAPGVDAVLVASPESAHEEALLTACERGLPVLCEKPLAPDSAASLRVVEAEVRAGRRLIQVGFMRRFDSEYQRLKSLLDAGELGRPLMLHCRHRNVSSPPHFTTPMLISSSVSHEIDAARWLLGQELTAVTVAMPHPSANAPEGLGDPQLVLFETARGALVDVEIFVNCGFGYQVRCEAVCERGSAHIGAEHGLVTETSSGAQQAMTQDYLVRFADAYDREVRSWIEGVREGRTTGPSAWDGYMAALVAEAGVRAQREGVRVAVPEPAPRPALYA